MTSNNRQTQSRLRSTRKRVFQWGDVAVLIDWLKGVMEESGLSQSDLARLLGIERQQVHRILKGTRRLTTDELFQISQKLGVKSPLTEPEAPPIRFIKVLGEVAAGVWVEVSYSDFEAYDIAYAYDPKFPVDAVYALVVRGESINRKAQDGDKVAVLTYDKAPRSFRDGDWVVVERKRTDLIERTVKQVRGSALTGWELWPDSTDPKHQEPLRLNDDGVESVRVVGFVLDFIRTGTRF